MSKRGRRIQTEKKSSDFEKKLQVERNYFLFGGFPFLVRGDL